MVKTDSLTPWPPYLYGGCFLIKENTVKHIIFWSILTILYISNTYADNFIWQFYDDHFYDETGGVDLGSIEAGFLTAVSDIYYTYDFNKRQLTVHQTEWLSDGAGSEYEAPYDSTSSYYLDLSDFSAAFDYNTNNDEILASFREQATNDITAAKNAILQSGDFTNIDDATIDVITNQLIDNIFTKHYLSTDSALYLLQNQLSIIKNTNNIGNTSAFTNSATKNISNGTTTNATNLSDAISNIDSTLGTIHGLNDKRGNNAKGNLAAGTTVEQHLVSLDDAIGNRSELYGLYLVPNGSIALNLQSLNDGLESERQNRIAGDKFTLYSAQSYTDTRIQELNKALSAGIASALALSSVASSGTKEGKMSFSGGYGYYNGQSAGAFGVALGIKDNWSVHAGAGLSNSEFSFRAGTSYEITLW